MILCGRMAKEATGVTEGSFWVLVPLYFLTGWETAQMHSLCDNFMMGTRFVHFFVRMYIILQYQLICKSVTFLYPN